MARPSFHAGSFFLCGTHQRGGGGVAFPAALCAAGAVHTVQRVGTVVAQLTAKAPRALQQTASSQDAAAHAGAQCHADDVRTALCGADPHFTQRHAVGVVGHCDGQAEVLFQRSFDRAADVVGKVTAGTGHDALAAVDLTGGRNADARKTFHRDGICGQKTPLRPCARW